ncbi:hypothetical protein N7517_002262 [Penicillium concentricum]|uniref:Uncharacterized protein n=1 Tax=Penicillium concentricum TaxID=293559 RepID=A0A9W9STQ9_9EURO|nr:uncharacterized protein N7517_002262 [Penicillium concentricum]KAJ5384351.1 hypothetical protein N7517_002262 [Penicillium concentricum]
MTQDEVNGGLGPPFAAIKFACHGAADHNKKGIIRIYIQIHITGTIARSPRARAQQAVTQRMHTKLQALKSLAEQKCEVVPDLLGYQEAQQDSEGCVPGGYINYMVWARVLGDSIDSNVFGVRVVTASTVMKCTQQGKFRSIWYGAHIEIAIILNIIEIWTLLIASVGAPLWPLFKKWGQQLGTKKANMAVKVTPYGLR